MNCEEIKEKMVALCADVFKASEVDSDIIEYADFIEDLGMDSITFITLIVEVESCFDITVPDDLLLMDNFKSVACVIGIVSDLMQNKNAK